MEYTQYMQGIGKFVPIIKVVYNNRTGKIIIQTMQQEVENMRVTRSFKPSWILDLYTNPVRVTNSRSAGMNPKGQGVNQALLRSQLHST